MTAVDCVYLMYFKLESILAVLVATIVGLILFLAAFTRARTGPRYVQIVLPHQAMKSHKICPQRNSNVL